MKSALQSLERLLLPNACVACEGSVESPDELVCGICRARLRRLAAGCTRCRQPRPPVGPCRFCAGWPPALVSVHSAVWLDRESREMLHHVKYGGYWALAEILASVIDHSLPTRPVGVLCPVPLGPRRLRERGYNQAEMIARALGKRWGRSVRPSILERAKDTRSQTTLNPAERKQNVAGTFSATSAAGAAPPTGGMAGIEKTPRGAIILVDDVLTTGATVAAAAAALEEAGWTDVTAVTFARAQPFVRRVLLD